jgi:hypothetical protein
MDHFFSYSLIIRLNPSGGFSMELKQHYLLLCTALDWNSKLSVRYIANPRTNISHRQPKSVTYSQ